MALEDIYVNLKTSLDNFNLSDKEFLLIIANLLLNKVKNFEELDSLFNILKEPLVEDYNNFLLIQDALDYNHESFALQSSKAAHLLISLANRIKIYESELYSADR